MFISMKDMVIIILDSQTIELINLSKCDTLGLSKMSSGSRLGSTLGCLHQLQCPPGKPGP